MMGCQSGSAPCLQGAKAGLPAPAAASDSTATLHKLALATGGSEKSWSRCVFPFGVVALLVGVAATCITFGLSGPRMDVAKLVSVAALLAGLGLLAGAALCWRARRARQRRKQPPQEPGAP